MGHNSGGWKLTPLVNFYLFKHILTTNFNDILFKKFSIQLHWVVWYLKQFVPNLSKNESRFYRKEEIYALSTSSRFPSPRILWCHYRVVSFKEFICFNKVNWALRIDEWLCQNLTLNNVTSALLCTIPSIPWPK